MRYRLLKLTQLGVSTVVILSPLAVFAQTASLACSQSGYTILTINGVFTDKEAAGDNKKALEERLSDTYKNENIKVDFLHNPSHLGGLGDIIKSIEQGLFDKEAVEDYDLVEMLKSASEKVKTQKLLLVAHSQGNFYANSFYDTVAGKASGVPSESIGVYSVATPSGRVAGAGRWITSDTDKVIAGVVGRTLHRPIMKPNTHIVLKPDDDSLGHNFSTIYLKYRSGEIVAGIGSSLDRLETNEVQDSQKPCLVPPKLTWGHKIEGVAFSIADPIATASNTAVAGVAKGMYDTGRSALAAVGAGISRMMNPRALFGVAGALYGTSVTEKDLQGDVITPASQLSAPPKLIPPPPPSPQPQPQRIPPPAPRIIPNVIAQPPIPTPIPTPTPTRIVPTPPTPTRVAFAAASVQGNSGGGGNGGIGIVEGNTPARPGVAAGTTDSAVSSSTSTSSTTTNAATTASTATTTSTGSTSSQPSQSSGGQATTTATSTVTTTPTPAPEPPPQDTTPPDISFTVSTCAASLAVSGCLIATTTIAMNWSSSASDFDHYVLTCTASGAVCLNFSYASTTATSSIFTAADNAAYIFSATAVDRNGNVSTAITKTVSVATRPVVINEIAWGGTSSSRSEDEWIELYNVTDYDITLANWVLRSVTDNTPYTKLSGTIAHNGFFVLERTDDTTISDSTANQIYVGGLANSGEVLDLSYASTTMDKTPTTCPAWCGGSAGSSYLSMERYDPYAAGDNQFNWASWAGFGASNTNAENASIHGTPGRRNSLNYLINKGSTSISANTTLKKSQSPYVITATNLSIGGSATVDIDAGVVIKFFGAGTLTINGIIHTHGTAADPVVFTSINDDAYGGDVNNDGSTTTPAKAGDWSTIQLTASGSVFDYCIIRYGGKIDPFFGSVQAQLQASNVAITITNSVSEFSGTGGFWFENVSGEVSSSTIRDNRALAGNIGMRVNGGSLAVKSNLFQRNWIGLFAGGSLGKTVTVSGNTFQDQTGNPIEYYGGPVSFSGNSAANNKLDGIVVRGGSLNNSSLGPGLPYIMDNDASKSVSSGNTLTVLPGAVLKFNDAAVMYVDGALDARGTAALPIVFTSLHDDGCGLATGCGDTDRATTSPKAGDWAGVIFRANGATTSVLDHAVVRYGGNKNVNIGDRGAVAKQSGTAPVTISNATIEKSFFAGVVVSATASTTITDSVIRDNLTSFGSGTAYGISLSASANPLIANTHFSNNGQHIATTSASWTNGGGNVFE